MEASPPSAFIKLDEIVEPLFGDLAPAIEDMVIPGAPGVVALSHGTVRKEENGRRRNERIIQAIAGYSVENFGEVQHFVARI
jgi:hypothetical protein